MRKVTFYIDDLEYFRIAYKLTKEQFNEMFSDITSFRVIYTLYGEGKNADRFTLTDYDGNKVNRNSLNGYERGVVLNDCQAYFVGGKYHLDGTEPCGVVKIEEEECESF